MSDTADDTIELDDYARDLLAAYQQTSSQIKDLDALRVKARDQLMAWFDVKGARRGTVDGVHAVTYSVTDRLSFDTKNFKEDQPTLFAQYAHLTVYRKLVT